MLALPDISATIRADLNPAREALDDFKVEAKRAGDAVANVRLYTAGQAEKDVVQAKEAAAKIRNVSKEGEGVLESLKGKFGRGSTFFELGHLLEGGGPILALGLVSNELKEATGEAVKMVDQFREGKIDADELAFSIGKSIPIFGGLLESADNVREMITGAGADVAKITAEAKASSDMVDLVRENFKLANAAAADVDETVRKLHGELLVMADLKLPFFEEFGKNIESAEKKAQETLQKIDDDIAAKFGADKEHPMKSLDDMELRIKRLTELAAKPIPELNIEGAVGGKYGHGVIDNSAERKAVKDAADAASKELQTLAIDYHSFQVRAAEAQAGALKVSAESSRVFGKHWSDEISKVRDSFTSVFSKLHKDAQKPIDDLKKKIAEMGLDEESKKILDLKNLGADPQQLAEYKKLLDQIKEADVSKAVDKQLSETVKRFSQFLWRDPKESNHEGSQRSADRDHFADFLKPGSSEALKLQFSMKQSPQKDEQGKKQTEFLRKIEDWGNKIYSRFNFRVMDKF